ncbi:MAG: pilin, partial [Candidatus Uhrbacteria bacterium]|nr:pilin [Candidatus Uhrbacteria bacterium]
RYGLSIGVIAATIMFIWGGFIYLVGSSGMASISKGKDIMSDAIIGLILLFSANLILRTLNPSLTIMRSLSVMDIKTELLDNYVPEGPMGGGAVIGGDSASGDFVPVQQVPKPEIAKAIIEGSKLAGVDPCIMLAICEHETGLRSIWNGYLAKRPKSSAIAFGACQVIAKNLRSDNPIVQMAKQLFPDFPAVNSGGLSRPDQLKIGDWLLSNPKGGAFVGAMIFKAGLRTTAGNELTAIAAYGAGAGSMQSWRRANNCSPTPGAKASDSSANDLASACVPHVVAIPKLGAPPGGCPEDKYVCADAKADASAQFTGHCSDGRKCYAMVTDSFVKYVLGAYPKMKSTYQCDQK